MACGSHRRDGGKPNREEDSDSGVTVAGVLQSGSRRKLHTDPEINF